LIEMTPDAAQSDLLQQVVDVRIPAAANTSVGDTLRYVLLHSGYRLCEDHAIGDFDRFPLPAAHMHLGPVPLASALQLLVGRDWQLETDEGSRRVCFSRRDSMSALAPSTSGRQHSSSTEVPPAVTSTGGQR
jgi:type IV pili sensor histidine kinase/response regulator